MAKRKSDLEHSSRMTYAREDDDADASNNAFSAPPAPGSFPRAEASTLASRRIVRRGSRYYRRTKYLLEIAKLNKCMREWAEVAEAQLESTPAPTVDDTETPPVFFLDAAKEYIRQAGLIKERYVLTHGDVMTFGNGDMGQLGVADNEGDPVTEATRPRLVTSLRDRGVVDLALGGLHSVGILVDGDVCTWGCNDEGQLGQFRFVNPEGVSPPIGFANFVDQVSTAVVPAKVTGFFPSGSSPTYPDDYVAGTDEAIVMAATGDCHTICLSTTGNVYFFGSYKDGEGKPWRDPAPPDENRGGQELVIEDAYIAKYIRDHDTPDRRQDEGPIQEEAETKRNKEAPRGVQKWPIHIYRLKRKTKFIAAGSGFNAAILDNDTVVTWGINGCGELGREVRPMVNKRSGRYDIDAIKNEHMMPMPARYSENPSIKRTVESLACGAWHLLVMARGVDNDAPDCELGVYSTGLNNYGQLGLGDKGPGTNRSELTRITALDGFEVSRVAAGYHHSLVLDGTGRKLFAFGRADYGQLGYTDDQPPAGHCETLPTRLFLEYDSNCQEQPEQPQVQSIKCGDNHNMVLTEGGELYTWGFGDTAALGHGVSKDLYRPKKVDFRSRNEREGNVPPTLPPIVRRIAGGGQSSAIVVTSSEH